MYLCIAHLDYSEGHKISNKVILREVPGEIICMKDLVSINTRITSVLPYEGICQEYDTTVYIKFGDG